MRLSDVGEFGLIERIKRIVARCDPDVLLGIDDDAAVLRFGDVALVVTTDAFVQDVHFRFDYFSPFDVGWRLMAANLSDLAAMGSKPRFAFVDLAVPRDTNSGQVLEFYEGMKALADRHGVTIVGGDTTSSPDRWFLGLSLVGEAEGGRFATRAGARPGDLLVVTGDLGGSAAGLRRLAGGGRPRAEDSVVQRHLRPEPRVDEGRFLVHTAGVRTMIDISDGLSSEVHHICRLSGVGAIVWAEEVPIHVATRQVAEEFGDTPLEYALNGGEDFELLFAVPRESWEEVRESWQDRFSLDLTVVGEVVAPEEGVKLQEGGVVRDLPSGGWQHFS